jgi:hypothetical protein
MTAMSPEFKAGLDFLSLGRSRSVQISLRIKAPVLSDVEEARYWSSTRYRSGVAGRMSKNIATIAENDRNFKSERSVAA